MAVFRIDDSVELHGDEDTKLQAAMHAPARREMLPPPSSASRIAVPVVKQTVRLPSVPQSTPPMAFAARPIPRPGATATTARRNARPADPNRKWHAIAIASWVCVGAAVVTTVLTLTH